MTYCVAAVTDRGIVFASDSRTHAGVDQLGVFSKMTVIEAPVQSSKSAKMPPMPEGYVSAWDDDRLNINRGRRTAAGEIAQDDVWTRTVPAELREDDKLKNLVAGLEALRDVAGRGVHPAEVRDAVGVHVIEGGERRRCPDGQGERPARRAG